MFMCCGAFRRSRGYFGHGLVWLGSCPRGDGTLVIFPLVLPSVEQSSVAQMKRPHCLVGVVVRMRAEVHGV
jgi:hypothetical protein